MNNNNYQISIIIIYNKYIFLIAKYISKIKIKIVNFFDNLKSQN